MEFSVMMGILMEGFALTAEIFLITLVGSLPLGVLGALARMSKFKPLAWLAQLYISILRGTPLMLQLMAIMFGPYYIFGLKMVGGQYNTADDPFLVSRYYVSRYTGLDSFAAMVAPAGT